MVCTQKWMVFLEKNDLGIPIFWETFIPVQNWLEHSRASLGLQHLPIDSNWFCKNILYGSLWIYMAILFRCCHRDLISTAPHGTVLALSVAEASQRYATRFDIACAWKLRKRINLVRVLNGTVASPMLWYLQHFMCFMHMANWFLMVCSWHHYHSVPRYLDPNSTRSLVPRWEIRDTEPSFRDTGISMWGANDA